MKLFTLAGVLGLVAALEVVVLGAVLMLSRLGGGDAWNSSVLVAFCTVLPLLLAQWYQGRKQSQEREDDRADRKAAALEVKATRDAAEAALERAEQGAEALKVIGHNVDGAKTALEVVAQRLRDKLDAEGIAQPPGTGGVDPKGPVASP